MIIVDSILHPSDFTENSAAALRYARALSQLLGSTLHIVNIVEANASALTMELGPPAPNERGPQAIGDRRMQRFLDRHGITADDVTAVSISGDPHSEILGYAERHSIGMIVMGTHGRRSLAQILMGSVAERVVRASKCPVLTVPEER